MKHKPTCVKLGCQSKNRERHFKCQKAKASGSLSKVQPNLLAAGSHLPERQYSDDKDGSHNGSNKMQI